ncbi:MAG: SDR family NAD(P)-dependent oxidoreductase [Candidatus Thorarchaeota archaeon]
MISMNNATLRKRKRNLEDSTIIITGASSGIGKELAIALASMKPNLVIVARRQKKIKQVAYQLKKLKIKVLPIVADVRNREDRLRILDLTIKAFGRVDVLVNNAGLGKVSLFIEQPEEEIDELIETNFLALVKMTQLILPIMKEQGGGHIINLSSTLALIIPYPFAVYNATKSAVKTFSDSLRAEAKNYGIAVSTVLPGPYDTNFHKIANVGSGSFKVYNVNKLAKQIAKLIIKPKRDLIKPNMFVILTSLTNLFPKLKRMISVKIGDQILQAKEETKKQFEKERSTLEKEKIIVVTN